MTRTPVKEASLVFENLPIEHLTIQEATFLITNFQTTVLDCRSGVDTHEDRADRAISKLPPQGEIPLYLFESKNVILVGEETDEKHVLETADRLRKHGITFPKILIGDSASMRRQGIFGEKTY